MSILGPEFDSLTPSSSAIDESKQIDMETGLLKVNPNADPDDPIDNGSVKLDELQELGMSQEQLERAAKLSRIAPIIRERKDKAMFARRAVTENIWLKAYFAWRGEYSPEEQEKINAAKSRNPGASEVFIKITKTKVIAAYGQILEILLNNNKIPIEVKPQEVPEGIADVAYIAPPGLADAIGYAGDGQEVAPGATAQSLLGGLYEKYRNMIKDKSLIKGPSPDPKSFIQLSPADEAAREMQKLIVSQLEKSEFQEELRKCALEAVIFGTGFIKGPVTYTQTIHRWTKGKDGTMQYTPLYEDVPAFYYVPCWNIYPDPNARKLPDAKYVVERHLMQKHDLRALRDQPGFDKSAIDRLLRVAPNYSREPWEAIIQDSIVNANFEKYEVLEYWGYLEKELLDGLTDVVDADDLAKYVNDAQVNIWICGNEVLRIVLNPYTPAKLPYFAVPFETHPYQVWGVGIPENMSDTQMLLNGHMRMGIDNLRLSGNVMLEVNEAQLVPGQEMALYPGKIFRKQGGAPGQTIYPINVTNTTQQHLMMVDKARQLMDESTGQSSLMYGQTGAQSGIRTASQTSMLLNGASLTTKTVIRNFDQYILRPVGEAIFAWNMQFNADKPEIIGDLKIVSNGTSALMAKEVQSQRLMSFFQLTGNPNAAPFVNIIYLIKQIAQSLDLDPDKAVNDPQQAALMASIMSQMQQVSAGPQLPQQAPNDPMGGTAALPAQTQSPMGANATSQPATGQPASPADL